MRKDGRRVESGTEKENNKRKMLAVEESKKGKRQQKKTRQRQTVRRTRQSTFKGKLKLYCYQKFDLSSI